MPVLHVARDEVRTAADSQELRCIDLWRSVLLLTIEDAQSVSVATTAAALHRREARSFLAHPSEARALVLEAAQIDLAAFTSRTLPRLRKRWAEVDTLIAAKVAAGTPAEPKVDRRTIKRAPTPAVQEMQAAA